VSTRRGLPVRLGVEVGGFALLALVLPVLVGPLVPAEVTMRSALDPVVVVGALWGAQLGYLLANLRAEPGRNRESLGLANAVTLVRGGLYAVVAGFVVVPAGRLAWVPAVCYGLGAALDRLDGYLARTVGSPSRLGGRLDMAFDTFGFVAAPLVAVAWGILPAWYLSLSAARYVFRGLVAWRRRRGLPTVDRPDSELGRYLAGFQMCFLTVALAPVTPARLVALAAPLALAPSLAVFVRDYLVVSGRVPAAVFERGRGRV
jgi:CDP-diacylglycerol--glycerol-3-phosphate 3-phosphatidyltransferase